MHHIHLIRPQESMWTYMSVPLLILFLLIIIGIWAVFDTVMAIRKPLTDEEYENWCERESVYASFISSMPYNLESYVMLHRNSFLFIKENLKTWRLFKLNSSEQKEWDSKEWQADKNEIRISEKAELANILNNLSHKAPEDLSPDEKTKIVSKILIPSN